MRYPLLVAAGLFLLLAGQSGKAASPTPANNPDSVLTGGLIARVHFAGTTQISNDPTAKGLMEIAGLPESHALRDEALEKLATAPHRYLGSRAASTNDYAAIIRSLLADLQSNESLVQVQNASNGALETVLAIKLDETHSASWKKDLQTVLESWTGITAATATSAGFGGWELKKHESPNLVGCFSGNGWLVLGMGDNDLKLTTSVLQRIKDKQRPVDAPRGYWIDAAVDWPALATHHLGPAGIDLPRMRLMVQGQKKSSGETYVRPQLTMEFAQPLQFSLKPWSIPTNLIHNPIVSFTAMRGLATGLSGLAEVKKLNANPVPDELFMWAMEQIPYETCLAAPVKGGNGTNYLEQIQPAVVSALKGWLTGSNSSLDVLWAGNQILVTGAPLVGGYMRTIREPDSDYLIAGLMPSPKRVLPLPGDLIKEINARPNLVAYDWELTGPRLKQWRGLVQLYAIVQREPFDLPESTTSKWAEAVEAKLGNSGTEVTLTGPRELTVVRNSGIGLTAFELSMLTYWFGSPGFPLTFDHDALPFTPGPRPGPR